MKINIAALLGAYAVATDSAQGWSDGDVIVNNDDIKAAAQDFSFNEQFISDEDFVHGVNLASDVLIAIEAIRIEVQDIDIALDDIDLVVTANEAAYLTMRQTHTTTDAQAGRNAENREINTQNISYNTHALDVIEDAIDGLRAQVDDHLGAAKLFCHQFIYTSDIPEECDHILINGQPVTEGGDRILEEYKWDQVSAAI